MNAPADVQTDTPSVGFLSLGCAKNLVDSQVMASNLLSEGLALAESPESADVVLVNTCAFIEDAREESLEAIRSACRLKRNGSCRAVIVAGCLPQRYRESLQESLPEVDAFLGVDELDLVGKTIRELGAAQRATVHVSRTPRKLFEPKHPTVVFSGGPFAYVKIAEGCNHRCAFCAIPGIRGAHRSRSPENVVAEARQLLDQGFRELNLISQDTTAYGRDLDVAVRLPGLLESIAMLAGEFWIRVLYGYPAGVTDELLQVLRDLPQVCPYLDIPIQHSHPAILAAMQRGRSTGAVRRLVCRARETVPGITLRTTCLVGFPGENDTHFEDLLRFVSEMQFDHLGVFTFSAEEGTPAAGMPRQVPRRVAEERREDLLEMQHGIVAAKAAALLGQEARLLLEWADAEEAGRWIGRTQRQAPDVDGDTMVTGVSSDHRPGDIIRVRYTGASDYDLLAEQITDRSSLTNDS